MHVFWQLFLLALFIWGLVWFFKKLKRYGDRERAKMSPEKRARMEKLHGWAMGAAANTMRTAPPPPAPKSAPVQQPYIMDGRWTDSGRPEWRDANGGFLGYADGLPDNPTHNNASN